MTKVYHDWESNPDILHASQTFKQLSHSDIHNVKLGRATLFQLTAYFFLGVMLDLEFLHNNHQKQNLCLYFNTYSM